MRPRAALALPAAALLAACSSADEGARPTAADAEAAWAQLRGAASPLARVRPTAPCFATDTLRAAPLTFAAADPADSARPTVTLHLDSAAMARGAPADSVGVAGALRERGDSAARRPLRGVRYATVLDSLAFWDAGAAGRRVEYSLRPACDRLTGTASRPGTAGAVDTVILMRVTPPAPPPAAPR